MLFCIVCNYLLPRYALDGICKVMLLQSTVELSVATKICTLLLLQQLFPLKTMIALVDCEFSKKFYI